MNLDNLRNEINEIDNELIELFQKRMEVASKIGEYKEKEKSSTMLLTKQILK